MGKFNNALLWQHHEPAIEIDYDSPETDYTPQTEEDWEAGFSDWKHDKDDDLATAVKRYARSARVALGDEMRRVA